MIRPVYWSGLGIQAPGAVGGRKDSRHRQIPADEGWPSFRDTRLTRKHPRIRNSQGSIAFTEKRYCITRSDGRGGRSDTRRSNRGFDNDSGLAFLGACNFHSSWLPDARLIKNDGCDLDGSHCLAFSRIRDTLLRVENLASTEDVSRHARQNKHMQGGLCRPCKRQLQAAGSRHSMDVATAFTLPNQFIGWGLLGHRKIHGEHFKFNPFSFVRVDHEEPLFGILVFAVTHRFDNQVHVLRIIV